MMSLITTTKTEIRRTSIMKSLKSLNLRAFAEKMLKLPVEIIAVKPLANEIA